MSKLDKIIAVLTAAAISAVLMFIIDLTGEDVVVVKKPDYIKLKKEKWNPIKVKAPTDSNAVKLGQDYFLNDTLYTWDNKKSNWVSLGLAKEDTSSNTFLPGKEPIRLNWKTLNSVNYRMKFYSDIGSNMYSPVYNPELMALNNKVVIIEGYVIPIDEKGEQIALSANTYTSCYFCGNASPASVMSVYMKDKNKKFALDAFKKFKGRLELNHDDPDQFYYILKDAEVL